MEIGKITIDDLLSGKAVHKDTILTFDRNAVLNMVYDKVGPLAIKFLYVALSRIDHQDEKIKIELSDLSLVGFTRINLQKRNFLNVLEELTHNYFIEDLGIKGEKGYGFLRNVYEYHAYKHFVIVDINRELIQYFLDVKPFLQCKVDLIKMKNLKTKEHLKFWELFESLLYEKESVEFILPIDFVARYMYQKKGERQNNMINRFKTSMEVIKKSTKFKIRYKMNKEANEIKSISFYLKK